MSKRSLREGASRWRRTLVVTVLTASTIGGVALMTSPSGAQTQTVPNGTGVAFAQGARIDPVAGGLSFGLGVGESLAGHQNTVASAEARSANLGVIGTTLAGEGCDGGDPTLASDDQPQPLRVDSTEPTSAEGRTGEDPKVPGVQRYVRATTQPLGEGRTEGAPIEVIPGIFTIGPITTHATSSAVDGVRTAVATTEVGKITIGLGPVSVVIGKMTWIASHSSADGSPAVTSTQFAIDGVSIAGQPVNSDDPTATLAQINAATSLLGIVFTPPTKHVDESPNSSVAVVDPLGIAIVPAPLRDTLLAGILGPLAPIKQAVAQAIIDLDCSNATFTTILDIALNSVSAGGNFSIKLGGVSASTDDISLFAPAPPRPQEPKVTVPPATTTPIVVTPGTPGTPGTPSRVTTPPTTTATATPPPAAAQEVAAPEEKAAAKPKGKRGGKLLGLSALGTLAILGALEGDRRKMRKAQREVPVEAY